MPEKFSKIVLGIELPHWLYDLIIVAGILVFTESALVAFQFGTALMNILGTLCFIAVAILIYGSFIEPWVLTVKRYEVGEGPREATIAFLSDIHVGPYKGERWLARVVRRVNDLHPDLVLIGGDLIHDRADQAPKLAPLAGLKSKFGSFAILGNHEWYYGAVEAVEKVLELSGVQVLRNRWVRVAEKLVVSGTDDDWYGETDFDTAVKGAAMDDAIVMLVHNPEVASHAAAYEPALLLSGHDHGGQIRLPFLGPVPAMPHNLGRKFDRGLFWLPSAQGTHIKGLSLKGQSPGSVPMIIGQGVGESGPRARLFCPPQIVYVTLKY